MDAVSMSVLGITVVFSALVTLAIAIVIISKILGMIVKTEGAKPAAAAAAPVEPGIDEETYAVLLAVMNEEARQQGTQFRVTSIKEL